MPTIEKNVGAGLSTTETTLYTVPAATRARVLSMQVTNPAFTDSRVSLDWVDADGPGFVNINEDQLHKAEKDTGNFVALANLVPSIDGGLAFGDAGNYFYINTSGGIIYQFSCATPYSVVGLSFVAKATQLVSNAGGGITFSSDGAYVFSANAANIHSRPLSTPWDVTTIGAETNYNASAQSSTNYSVQFKTDGTKMFTTGDTNFIYEYALSTPWDITTAIYTATSVTVPASSRNLMMSLDGTKAYSINHAGIAKELTLSTPWDITTAAVVAGTRSATWKMVALQDSQRVLILDNLTLGSAILTEYFIPTTGTLASGALPIKDILDPSTYVSAFNRPFLFNATGTRAFWSTDTNGYQIDLEVPYDLRTAEAGSAVAKAGFGNLYAFTPDGSYIIYRSTLGTVLSRARLSTPYDLTTAALTGTGITTYNQTERAVFSADGMHLYHTYAAGQLMHNLLPAPWDISSGLELSKGATATFSTNLEGVTVDQLLGISDDGSIMYVDMNNTSLGGPRLGAIELSIPYDLSTMSAVLQDYDLAGGSATCFLENYTKFLSGPSGALATYSIPEVSRNLSKHAIMPNKTVAALSYERIPGGLILEEGDTIIGSSSAEYTTDVSISLQEIS